jgi:hypothetical protein
MEMVFTVFISHSTEDMDVVYELAKYLRLNGINVYVSEWYEQPGKSLPQKVATLINGSDYVLALLTVHGERSRWVQQEIGYAKGTGKPIIPVVEDGVPITGFLQSLEYISFRRDNPYDAVTRAVEYLKTLAIRKEQEERSRAILGGLLFLFGLLALGAIVSGEGSR